MEKFKRYLIPVLAAVIYGIIVALNTKENVINSSGIMLYIVLGMVLPIVVSILQGVVTGCILKEFKKSIGATIMTTILIGGLAILVSYLFIANN